MTSDFTLPTYPNTFFSLRFSIDIKKNWIQFFITVLQQLPKIIFVPPKARFGGKTHEIECKKLAQFKNGRRSPEQNSTHIFVNFLVHMLLLLSEK